MGLKALFRHSRPTAAVFIDFEHWCYSLSKLYGLRPRVEEFYNEIREQYDVRRIFFFGDFTKQKIRLSIDEIRQVTNHIIETQNASPHIKKDYTDFIMLDYIYQDIDDHPHTDVYIIFSGDGHFSSAANYLKQKKKKKVVIYGVTGATSQKLQKIADEAHLIPMEGNEKMAYYKMILDNLSELEGQNRILYAAFMKTVRAVAARNSVPEEKIQEALQDLVDLEVIKREKIHTRNNRWIRILKTDWKLAAEKGLWDEREVRSGR